MWHECVACALLLATPSSQTNTIFHRGQFTFHKNVHKVNNVWRKCEYLSDLVSRYSGKQKWRFESAEGCYSYAAVTNPDIKVKYVVKAMTDFGGDDAAKEGLKLLTREGAVVVVKPGKVS